MDENRFTNILSRAQQLMLDENFNRMVEQKAKGGTGNLGDSSIAAMEASVFGYANENSTPVQAVQPVQPQMIAEQTNVKGIEGLPEYLRESFTKTPPLTGDRMEAITKELQQPKVQQQVPQRQVVTETVIPNGNGIDYSLLKVIIDESISRHLNTLNESTGPTMKGMRFINGNTFQFVDNKGNLYEGVLKLKKKAK